MDIPIATTYYMNNILDLKDKDPVLFESLKEKYGFEFIGTLSLFELKDFYEELATYKMKEDSFLKKLNIQLLRTYYLITQILCLVAFIFIFISLPTSLVLGFLVCLIIVWYKV